MHPNKLTPTFEPENIKGHVQQVLGNWVEFDEGRGLDGPPYLTGQPGSEQLKPLEWRAGFASVGVRMVLSTLSMYWPAVDHGRPKLSATVASIKYCLQAAADHEDLGVSTRILGKTMRDAERI